MPERDVAFWLQKAEEARKRAGEMLDPSAKASIMEIAARYTAMARIAEDREVRAKIQAAKDGPSSRFEGLWRHRRSKG
jgi:hypothetical protein